MNYGKMARDYLWEVECEVTPLFSVLPGKEDREFERHSLARNELKFDRQIFSLVNKKVHKIGLSEPRIEEQMLLQQALPARIHAYRNFQFSARSEKGLPMLQNQHRYRQKT